ncbi:MAG TPA: UDP-N-acetylmuramate--L-alanine ligase [Nitrospirales bacterium]|jgi:UDP-N-acetylmuramate--alanine ligase
MFKRIQQIHFVGIGGAGMSGIAEVLLTIGYKVTGSDLQESETVKRIRSLGGIVFIGHAASNVGTAQVVVISSAVSPTNPEVVAAKAKLIPVIPRAEMLAELMRLKYGVAIAGAHGKTTTTSLVAHVLAEGGLDPTIVIGGKVNALGSHARLGRGELLVAEADESDGSFLKLSPTIVAVTNMDREHLDHYGTMERLNQAFVEFINKIPFYGLAVLCVDDPQLAAMLPLLTKRFQTYGLAQGAELQGANIELQERTAQFSARLKGEDLGRFRVAMPGVHNVRNALAAIAIGLELGVPVAQIALALESFTGVERRFQIVGEKGGITMIDDYGHHPTEIKATLAAAKGGSNRRLVVLFQPHRYTRTQDLVDEFAVAFNQADLLFLTEIYAAGESPIPGVNGERLAQTIQGSGGPPLTYVPRKEELVEKVLPHLRSGDLVLTMGAGDIWKTGRALLERLP